MQLSFIGYDQEGRNPDGSYYYAGNPVYTSPNGVTAEGHWLIEQGFLGGLGDNPEVPPHLEHWFVKKTNLNKPIKSEEERLKAMAEVDALMKIPEGEISEELGDRLEVLAILIQDYEKRTVRF